MASKRSSILEAINDPTKNFLATFLVSTLLFSLVADGVSSFFWGSFSDWLQHQLGITSKNQFQGLVLLGLILLILGLIYGTNVGDRFKRLLLKFGILGTRVPDRAAVVPMTRTVLGLVVLMSTKADSPAELAIRHHWHQGQASQLQHCWIICTESSLPYAVDLKRQLLGEGIDENQLQLHYGSYELNDPSQPGLTLTISDQAADDPDTMLSLIDAIYADGASFGLSEADIVVDFTGGTKPMGAGSVLACASPDRRLEYYTQTEPKKFVEVKVAYKIKSLK